MLRKLKLQTRTPCFSPPPHLDCGEEKELLKWLFCCKSYAIFHDNCHKINEFHYQRELEIFLITGVWSTNLKIYIKMIPNSERSGLYILSLKGLIAVRP